MAQREQRRRRWLITAAVTATVSLGVAGMLGTRAGRGMTAHSMRMMMGPPPGTANVSSPSSTQRIQDPVDALHRPTPTRASSSAVGVDPDASEAPTADPPPAELLRPARPRGVPGVSFVLMLGVDKSHPKVRGRTDAMIVAGFRHRDGKVAAFSVPRDLWVDLPDVPGRGAARINAVARVGDVRLGAGEGLPLLRGVLERELGVRIDHYALIDFEGFVELVDDLGGIDVQVQCPIKDCFWLDGPDEPCTMMDVPVGVQTLDGRRALLFARSRHGRGDRDRTRRQQAVLMGFARKARASGLEGLRRLWQTAAPHIESDLDWRAATYYASYALDNELADVRGMSIRHPMVKRHVTDDNKHVLRLDHSRYDEAFAELFERSLPALQDKKHCPDADAALTFRDDRK